MARTHAKDANYSFNSVALETELNNIVMTADVTEADATAFADTYQVPVAGKKSVAYELQGTVDPAASKAVDTIFDARLGGVKTSVYDLTGSGPGANDPEYTCTASGLTGSLVAQLRVTYAIGDAARFAATIQNSGATTRATA
ncbi:hypothetical protein CMI37_14495 [Candidatus Pacearchaeota archaeon]|nr:hypothetical protein [Candidatus Pacearchaeota archaeon]